MKPKKRKFGCLIAALLALIFLPYIYLTFFHIPSRTYTRENTGLERLPPGVAIPMMPDGSRVDYVRAYQLIYPRLTENPEENGWREIVSFLGPVFFINENPVRQTSDDEEYRRRQLEFFEERRPDWEAYCRKLALAPESFSVEESLARISGPSYVERTIRERLEAEARALFMETEEDENAVYIGEDFSEIVDQKLYSTGWSVEEYPEMAAWVAEHEEFLALAAKAVRRERYILPFYRNGDKPLVGTLIPDIGFQAVLRNCFLIRATMNLQLGETEKALADAESIWRLGRHLRRTPVFLVSYMVGIRCENDARKLTLEILRRNTVPPEQMLAFSEMLDALPAPVSLEEIEDVEHWAAYEFFDRIPLDDLWSDLKFYGSVHWMLDHTIAAERFTELKKMNLDDEAIRELSRDVPRKAAFSWSVRARSVLAGEFIYSLMIPAMKHVHQSTDQAECSLQLTRITLSLKCYHAEHGAYPETLDALVPEFLTQIPIMPGLTPTEPRPLTYTRRGDGFLLAAVKPGFDPEKEPTKEDEDGYEYEREMLFVVKMPD